MVGKIGDLYVYVMYVCALLVHLIKFNCFVSFSFSPFYFR